LVLNTNSTQSTYGNDYLSSQIYESHRFDKSVEESLENGLSIANLTDCFIKLKDYYNLTENESLGVIKTDSSIDIEDIINGTSTKTVNVVVYTMRDKKRLNLSICNDYSVQIKLPLKNVTEIATPVYLEYKNQSIDIYNPYTKAFISRCYTYAMNGYDTTANMRRKYIFANKTFSCSNDCIFKGIDENNYITCSCSGLTEDDEDYYPRLVIYILESYNNVNLDIIKCADRAFDVYST
jgi:hypothetical protein